MQGRRITTEAELDALYGAPKASAILKEQDRITPDYAALIAASPFVVLATMGPRGLDCSPRGDPAGLVAIEDPGTLLLPDRRGNNRLDSLRNIVHDPRVALLFLIPGKGETLRVSGTAEIVADAALSARFAMAGKAPATVLRIAVARVYFQCQKAIRRAGLWTQTAPPEGLPSAGRILANLDQDFDGETYDAEYPARMAREIY